MCNPLDHNFQRARKHDLPQKMAEIYLPRLAQQCTKCGEITHHYRHGEHGVAKGNFQELERTAKSVGQHLDFTALMAINRGKEHLQAPETRQLYSGRPRRG